MFSLHVKFEIFFIKWGLARFHTSMEGKRTDTEEWGNLTLVKNFIQLEHLLFYNFGIWDFFFSVWIEKFNFDFLTYFGIFDDVFDRILWLLVSVLLWSSVVQSFLVITIILTMSESSPLPLSVPLSLSNRLSISISGNYHTLKIFYFKWPSYKNDNSIFNYSKFLYCPSHYLCCWKNHLIC